MTDCPIGKVDVGCILSYDGDVNACIINYVMLTFQLCVNGVYLYSCMKKYNSILNISKNVRKRCVIFQCIALLFTFLFQVVLCIFVGCSGVSIVWNVMVGFLLFDIYINVTTYSLFSNENESYEKQIFILLCLPAFITDVFYAVTADLLTSLAHLCALALGCIIQSLYFYYIFKSIKLEDDSQHEIDIYQGQNYNLVTS